MDAAGKKERFLKVYADLPVNARSEIIYVLPEKGPITWNAAYIEVSNDTPLGQQLLENLAALNFI